MGPEFWIMLNLLGRMISSYMKLHDVGARANFEQNVDSLRETVRTLLEFLGPRIATLPHLWQACTVFRLVAAEIDFENLQSNEPAMSFDMLEKNMRNHLPLQNHEKCPIAKLGTCCFLPILTEDIACGKQLLMDIQSGMEDDGSGLSQAIEDLILFLVDCDFFVNTALSKRDTDRVRSF